MNSVAGDPKALRAAMQPLLNPRIHAKGQITFPAIPSAVEQFTAIVSELFDALDKGNTEEDRQKIRDALRDRAEDAFEKSPDSVVVVAYESDHVSDAVSWEVRNVDISTEEKYDEWLAERDPPLFGVHPDAKLLAVARDLGQPEEVTFLDVGAGTGRNSLPMARAGHPTDAVEPARALASELRNEASREGLEIAIGSGDFWDESLVLPRDCYRLILLSEVCAHLRGVAWLRPLFERFADLLEPGGVGLFNLFLAEPELESDAYMREASEVLWTPFVTREEVAAAVEGLPLELVSEDEVLAFEKAHQPTWPPTYWYEAWITGQDLFDLPDEETPVQLHWLTYRRT